MPIQYSLSLLTISLLIGWLALWLIVSSSAASSSMLLATVTIPPAVTVTLTPTTTPTSQMPPGQPILAYPGDGAVINTEFIPLVSDHAFEFTGAAGGIWHIVVVSSEDGSFYREYQRPMIADATPIVEILPEGAYRWYVNSCRPMECRSSETWTFTIDYDAVASTLYPSPTATPTPTLTPTLEVEVSGTLIYPASVIQEADPEFQFSGLGEPTSHTLYVHILGTSPDIYTPPLHLIQPCQRGSCPLTVTLPPGDYMWWVVECEGVRCEVISDRQNFTIAEAQ